MRCLFGSLPLEIYEGHFKKRATVSGEYQGTSGVTLRLMQPGKNWAQYVFFSASVPARGFSDWFVRMHSATAESHISFLQVSPAGEAEAGVAKERTYPAASAGIPNKIV
jgi:hypothetical protein